jgi:transposase
MSYLGKSPSAVPGASPMTKAQVERSHRRSSATCSKASTGGCRNRHGDRRQRADCGVVNHGTIASSQAHRLVIPSFAMSIDDSLPPRSCECTCARHRAAPGPLLCAAQERATAAENEAQYRALLIEKLKFTIRKLRHDRFGQSSERGTLLDQLELQLADLEADAAQA